MANNEAIIVGAGCLAAGLMIGMMINGKNTSEAEKKFGKRLAAQTEETVKAVDGKMASLDERLAALEKSMAAGAEAQSGMSTALTKQIDGAVSALSAKVDDAAKAGATQSAELGETLTSGLGDMSKSLAAAAAAAGAAGVAAAAAPAGDEDTATGDEAPAAGAEETVAAAPAASDAAPAADAPKGSTVGQTEYLMDGKIRAFVSGVNEGDGTVRVAVNGQTVQLLRPRRKIMIEIDEVPCAVMLDDIVKGHVTFTASCEE